MRHIYGAEEDELKSRSGRRCATDFATCYNDNLNGYLMTRYFQNQGRRFSNLG